MEPLVHGLPYPSGHFRFGLRGVDEHAALGLMQNDLPIGVAQFLMERERLGFEPIGRVCAAPLVRARQPEW